MARLAGPASLALMDKTTRQHSRNSPEEPDTRFSVFTPGYQLPRSPFRLPSPFTSFKSSPPLSPPPASFLPPSFLLPSSFLPYVSLLVSTRSLKERQKDEIEPGAILPKLLTSTRCIISLFLPVSPCFSSPFPSPPLLLICIALRNAVSNRVNGSRPLLARIVIIS